MLKLKGLMNMKIC